MSVAFEKLHATYFVAAIFDHLRVTRTVACLPAVSLALDDCSAELAIFDQRIENTDHPAYNVQLALQMRQGIEQNCGFLDEQVLGHLLDNLD